MAMSGEWIGYLAAFLTTACYVPQAAHIIFTRQTAGLSLLAYGMLFAGVAAWFAYGVVLHSWPLMAANGITLVLVGIILGMKLRLG